MSYVIATSLKINGDTIEGKGGCNNVKPFYTYPILYTNKDHFMMDILGGGLTIDRVNSKLGDKIREAKKKVIEIHQAKYGDFQDAYMYGIKSINPYSLFMIGDVYSADARGEKDSYLESALNLSHINSQYHTQKLIEHAIYKGNWDEYVRFYKLLLTIFFKEINVNYN